MKKILLPVAIATVLGAMSVSCQKGCVRRYPESKQRLTDNSINI